jgi:nucleoid-associated protein YgaU
MRRTAAAKAQQVTRVAVSPRVARATPPATAGPQARTDVARTAPPAPPAAAARGRQTHIVRPGESLWSVARDQLGSRASTAQLAREVHRLWELNKDRIGTGDPDLLMVGTRLELR